MESFLRPCVATGVSPLAVSCLSGVTPRSQPWTTAVTLPHGRDGLGARWMAVLWTFCQPSLCRHVRRELLRNAWLDFTPTIPTTVCHQRNYVETYSRYSAAPGAMDAQVMHHSHDVVGGRHSGSCEPPRL